MNTVDDLSKRLAAISAKTPERRARLAEIMARVEGGARTPRYEARLLPGHEFPTYGIYDTLNDAWMGDHLGWREWMTTYDYYAAEVAAKLNATAVSA